MRSSSATSSRTMTVFLGGLKEAGDIETGWNMFYSSVTETGVVVRWWTSKMNGAVKLKMESY